MSMKDHSRRSRTTMNKITIIKDDKDLN